jgi:serine/threonine-protein kinase HipA
MARNMDDHTKNHSFRLKERGNWGLSPAYDLTYAHNPNGNWNHQHFLAVNRKHDNITRADLLVDAERFSIADRKLILDQVAAAVGRWPEFAAQAGVPSDKADEIRQDLRPL